MTKDRVKVLVIALTSPLLVGVYKEDKLIDSYKSNQKTSDILPEIFEDILSKYDIESLFMAIGPGSFMSIKVSYIFLKTLSISKDIELLGCDGFYFNKNSPIKAVNNRFFMKKNGKIGLAVLDGDKDKIKPFELPNRLDKTIFKKEVEPLYVLPAVWLGDRLIIKTPATSANLGPGFDTLGLAIELLNEVKITKSNFISVSIKGEGANRARVKTNNQFVNIFYNFYTKLVGKRDNFRFEFINNIPFSRGLGSSSAVIVSAIASAYYMAGIKLSKDSILNKALFYEPHPDNIAPATHGGFVSSLIYKDRVISQKKEIPTYLRAVVVIPNKPMSTNQSRGKLPRSLSLQKAVFNISHSTVLASAFFNEDWKVLKYASKDMIHEDIRMRNLKELFKVRELALENGALMSTLSGSGSTFFNLVYQDDANSLKEFLEKNFPHFRVEIYNFNNIGYNIID